MPDVSLTAGQELLRNAARDFVERECPLAEVRRIDDEEAGFSRSLWRKICGLGWAGILIPTEFGGEGGSLTDCAVLYEELGRGLLPSPHISSAVLAAEVLVRAGTEAQKQRLLPTIARGERIVAVAITEADYGWTPEHVRMAPRLDGGSYVLDGAKAFVADAGAADELTVAVRGGGGVTLLLVDTSSPGVELRPMRAFAGDPVSFHNVTVPAENVIGDAEHGWEAIAPAIDVATALACAYAAGATRRVYEMSIAYAQRREQFGQPVARFQRVQDRLIEQVNAADAARLTAYEAVWKLEHDKPDAEAAVSVAKIVASEGFYAACEHAHHVHAGVGSDKSYGLYLYTKKSRSFYHHLGDPAHHRRRLATLLGL